jgi:hypothetical protein
MSYDLDENDGGSASPWDPGGGDAAGSTDGGDASYAASAYDSGAGSGAAPSPYGDMFDGPAATAMTFGGEPPELTPQSPEIPEGIGQEYTVDPELEELAAKVARGEMTAAEASGSRGILATLWSMWTTIGSSFVNFLPPIPKSILRAGTPEDA